MAFENISKGKFTSFGELVGINETDEVFVRAKTREDAQFISFCFNLQQRYDISKLEEAVKALEFVLEKDGHKFIAELLKEIKK